MPGASRLASVQLISRNSLTNSGSTEKPNSSAGNLPRFFAPCFFGNKNSAIANAALRRSTSVAVESRAMLNKKSGLANVVAASPLALVLRSADRSFVSCAFCGACAVCAALAPDHAPLLLRTTDIES